MSGAICGGFPKLTKQKPDNWIDAGYHIMIDYPADWTRVTLGKVLCDCKRVHEVFMPFYGLTWSHEESCAIMKHYRRWPQMENFMYERDVSVIGQSE